MSQPPTPPRTAGNDVPLFDAGEFEDVEDLERDLELDDEEFN